jgi:ribonuclease J
VSSVRILPLGGLGEIGKNMTAIESEGRIVIVDTGLMFPTSEMLGIDLVLPDFTPLRERADDIEAIVLTHGHEDHVGALPYVLRELGIPKAIYSGPLTIGLVRSKLEEHKLRDVPLEVVETGERVKAGPFEIEMIHMSHSIPDSRAVALHTDLGAILVTGDYRFDQTPIDGRPADMARLAQLGA